MSNKAYIIARHYINQADCQQEAYRLKKEMRLMPLTFAKEGELASIKKVGGNLIVNIKDSRVAIGKDMASRIMV